MTGLKHDALLLDLGNVVFPLQWDHVISELALRWGVDYRSFRSIFNDIYMPYDGGQIGTDEFLAQVRRAWGIEFTREEFEALWVAVWHEDTPGMDELLAKAREAGLRTAVLSNTNPMHMDYFLPRRTILKRFDVLFLSYEIGASKPDPVTFHHVIQSLDLPPGRILFMDDQPDNIEGARQCGLDAYVFESAAQVEQLLGL